MPKLMGWKLPRGGKKPSLTERGRFIALAGSCAALLLVALLLPLAFRRAPEPAPAGENEDPDQAAKAAVFVDYWYDGGDPVTIEKLDHPASRTVSFCQKRMDALVGRYINDLSLGETQAQGSEYTVVTQGKTELRLCRMWLQVQGDWQNWMDVCMDAETGDLYYLYVSRECLTNRSLYTVPAAEKPTVEHLADWLASAWNSRLRHIQRDEMGKGTAVLSTEDGTLAFEISCITYDALVDIKISCI
ncbi:MAG: hypothetical protein IJ705_06430 [Oscillospiraceae bacterium]|nr:hypothetical protein [Oscillospiraceae bacterium]